MNDLTLLPKGVLHYSKSLNETVDVSHLGHLVLDDYVELDENFTLRDLCLFIQKNEDVFFKIFGSNVPEYVQEILNYPHSNVVNDEGEIDYLMISNHIVINDENMSVPSILNFNGVTQATESSEEVVWAMGLSDISKYADTKLKCSDLIEFTWMEDKQVLHNRKFKSNGYTLYQILSAVLYEISWYGTPEQKKELTLSLKEMMHNIETKNEKFEKLDLKNI